MTLSTTERGDLRLEAIPDQFSVMLRLLPGTAAHGEKDAIKRLYPDPAGPEERELREDWDAFVKPSLRHLFESARETVRADLARMTLRENGWAVTLPREHLPAWMNCLTQARLIIAEQIGYTEDDLDRPSEDARPTSRDLDLIQMEFYAHVLESILRAAARTDEGGRQRE